MKSFDNGFWLAIALVAVVVISGCVTQPPATDMVTFDQLVQNPQQYNGTFVKTSGIVSSGLSVGQFLVGSIPDQNNPIEAFKNGAIYLDVNAKITETACATVRGFTVCQASVEGIFEYGGSYGPAGYGAKYRIRGETIPTPNEPHYWAVGEEVFFSATVESHNTGCYVDALCSFRVIPLDSSQSKIDVVYNYGKSATPCYFRGAVSGIQPGDSVEVLGKMTGKNTVSVCDSNGHYIREVISGESGAIPIDSTDSLNGIVGQRFFANFSISGGYSGTGDWPLYEWFVASGALPDGLALAPDVSVYCVRAPCPQPGDKASIQGIPTKAGAYNFELLVEHDDGRYGKKPFTITISEALAGNKVVYGMNAEDENEFRADCDSRGGTFDDCDSACPNAPPGTSCIQVCVMSCTIP